MSGGADIEGDKMIRKTSILCYNHTYVLEKVKNEKDLTDIGVFDKLHYC
jgi:hypothetical protein